ncbi:MAG: hypothetical protein R3C39_01220 [Dehalococcoidia bacterium]
MPSTHSMWWRIATPLALALLFGILLAACGGGEADTTPTSSPTATSTATPTAGAVASLRDVDFTSMPYVGDLIDRAGGGEVPAERVTFEDLTGDGTEEAVVVVESGGTLGDIGVGIYRLEAGRPVLADFHTLGGRVDVRLGLVIIEEGVYAAGDAECCPSQLHEIAIGWENGAFAVVSDQTIDNPAS